MRLSASFTTLVMRNNECSFGDIQGDCCPNRTKLMTYLDRAWCSHKCNNWGCFRNYTDEEHQRNINGVDLPLSISDFKTDDCGYLNPAAGQLKCSRCGSIYPERHDPKCFDESQSYTASSEDKDVDA